MKLGLGTWHLTNKELPRQAFELGINHFDTADIYLKLDSAKENSYANPQ